MLPRPMVVGPASLDRYLDDGVVLPGGGALNMAYHWVVAGMPFELLTRIGDDDPSVFTTFLDRHGIAVTPDVIAPGVSSSIDIRMGADRQPQMDRFVEGVWRRFRLSAAEEERLASAPPLHLVLVAPAEAELHRLGAAGRLAPARSSGGPAGDVSGDVSGDFLSLRRWTVDRFDEAMRHLTIGFVGWPGPADDPVLAALRTVAFGRQRLVVITLGQRGVLVFDGRCGAAVDRVVPVVAVPVRGTTVGCGDAFIAAFLQAHWHGAGIDTALDAARAAGAAATAWTRSLPEPAYGLPSPALRP